MRNAIGAQMSFPDAENWRDKWGLTHKPIRRCKCGVAIGTKAVQCRGCHNVERKRPKKEDTK